MIKRALILIIGISISQLILAQPRYNTGMDFDDAAYAAIPKKAKLTRALESLPPTASLKIYAPIPGNQGQYGTCTAWATAYCARTIVEAIKNEWTDKKTITANAYSPAFLFRMIRPGDNECVGGSTLSKALEVSKEKGLITYASLSAPCVPTLSAEQIAQAGQSKVKDYMRLFDANASDAIKIQSVKKSLAERKPVVFGMRCPQSFYTSKGTWQPTEQPTPQMGGHAMCVVGYDDNKDGGAFEVQNSWGAFWANDGYIWIKYDDFARFTFYAYEFIDLPEPKPEVADLSGQIKLTLASGANMPAALQVSTRGLVVVPAKTTPGPLTKYTVSGSYTSGTRFRIYISNNQPAYVYALSSDLSNEVTKIFPYEEGISAALTDKRNNVAIPDEDHFIEFDNKPGTDFLCVLYSRNELNINDVIKQMAATTGSFSERVFKVLQNQIVDPKNIKFSKEDIAFEGFSKGKTIIPLMVELEHK
jgi:hypothetical protein